MKTFLKIIKIAVLAFFIVVIALAVIGWLMEDRITRLAVQKVSETVKAPLGMESVTFSLIRNFPLATVQFNGLWMGAPNSSNDSIPSQAIDTLARFDKLYVSVESKPLLDNIFNILEVDVQKGFVKYLVDEEGGNCYDFLFRQDTLGANDQDTTANAFSLSLDEVNLKDLTLIYSDEKRDVRANVFIPEIEGAAKIDSLTTFFSAKGGATLTNCQFEQSNLYKMQQADLQFDLLYNSDSLIFEETNITTEGASIDATGRLFFGEELTLDINLSSSGLDLAELSKYIPSEMLEEYKISRISGTLDLQSGIKGVISNSELPRYDARFTLSKGSVKYEDYPVFNGINVKGTATNGILQNNSTTAISIEKLGLRSAGNSLALIGSFSNLDQLHYNLTTKMVVDLKSLRPFIPDTLVQDIKGRVIADVETKGILPDSIDSQFVDYLLQNSKTDLDFSDLDISLDSTLAFSQASGKLAYKNHLVELDSFNVSYPRYDLKLVNNSLRVNLDKKVSNTDSIRVNLTTFHMVGLGSSVKGTATINNLRHPDFSLEASVEADLGEVKRLVPDSLVDNMIGKINAHVKSSGRIDLDSITQQLPDLIYDKTTVRLNMADVGLKMPDTLLNVSHLSGRVDVTPQMVTLQDLQGTYEDIQFKMDTTVVKNLYNTAFRGKKGRLEVEGVYRFDHVDYDKLMALVGSFSKPNKEDEEKTDEKNKDENHQVSNWDYEVKGKLFVNSVKYKKAIIKDISGLFSVRDSTYIIDQLQFKAFEGEMNTAIKVWFKPNGEMELFTRNKLDHMNIRRLLYEMNNFDKTYFTYKNISGVLTTEELYTRLVFVGDSVIYPETRMTGDFLLEKGGIYNFEPVEVLAPNIPNVDRLDTLEFKTINTHLFVFKDTLCIPETYVVSNIFDISTIGMQSFNMDYEYHLEVKLGEVLMGTSKKRQREKESIKVSEKKKDKEFKWIMLYTDENGEPKAKLFPNKKERNLMALDIKSRNKSLFFRFNYNVSFETRVSGYIKNFY